MKLKIAKIPLKIIKYTGIGLGSILLMLFLLPVLFPGFVSDKIKKWANNSIEAELNFSKARLSFFNHFPSLTLTLYDVHLNGSAPFKNDTMVNAKEIALGVDVSSILSKTLRIDEVYITNGTIQVLVNKDGLPNYNIYKSTASAKNSNDTSSSEAALKLERIQIEDCALVYNDLSIPILIQSKKLNYIGKGDLSKSIFDLSSRIQMEGLNLSYGNEAYLQDKKINAKLITRINTNSLELDFQKNDLLINQLPVAFNGTFNFLKNGYRMNFNAKTEKTDFKNVFTALPPAFVQWVDRTNVQGKVLLNLSLKGDFISSENKAPTLLFDIDVQKGALTTALIKEPIEDIFLKLHVALPDLNTANLQLQLDTLNAVMGKDYVKAVLQTTGLQTPTINGNIDAIADVEKWAVVMGLDSIASIQLKGLYQLKANLNGVFNPSKKQFPVTHASMQWKNGYLQTAYYPTAITNIEIDGDVVNTKGNMSDLNINIKPISLQFEGQPFSIKASLNNFDNLVYDITSKGTLNIGKLYKLFAVKGYNINGFIKTDIALQGSQADAMAKRFDKLSNKGTIEVKNINLSTPYFPKKFTVNNGVFHINNDQLVADNMVLNYINNTVTIKGQFSNIINYLLQPNAPLKGKLSLNSKLLLIHELMALSTDTIAKKQVAVANTSTSGTGVVMIPPNLDIQFNANINSIDYNGLVIKSCVANAAIQNGKLRIPNAAFSLVDAPVNMQASYAPINTKRASFSYHLTAKDVDIQKAYKEIKLFREMATSAGKVKGLVSVDYTLNGLLNDSLYPVFPTIKGGGTLSISNAKVYGFKLFNAISKQTGKEAINNPDLSKRNIQLKTTIANNIITIEKIKLRVAGFRPKFEGQVSLDGKLNLKARLGLPPFGIFGIPLSITGTQNKPIVRLKRGKKSDTLQETEADEEDKKEAAEAEAKEKLEQQKQH